MLFDKHLARFFVAEPIQQKLGAFLRAFLQCLASEPGLTNGGDQHRPELLPASLPHL